MIVYFINTPYLLFKGDLTREMFSNVQISNSFKTLGIPKRERATDIICASDIKRCVQTKFPYRRRYEARP